MTNMQVDHPLPNTSNSASGASGASSEVDVSFDYCYAVLNNCTLQGANGDKASQRKMTHSWSTLMEDDAKEKEKSEGC